MKFTIRYSLVCRCNSSASFGLAARPTTKRKAIGIGVQHPSAPFVLAILKILSVCRISSKYIIRASSTGCSRTRSQKGSELDEVSRYVLLSVGSQAWNCRRHVYNCLLVCNFTWWMMSEHITPLSQSLLYRLISTTTIHRCIPTFFPSEYVSVWCNRDLKAPGIESSWRMTPAFHSPWQCR